jgi:hypothetical protein
VAARLRRVPWYGWVTVGVVFWSTALAVVMAMCRAAAISDEQSEQYLAELKRAKASEEH